MSINHLSSTHLSYSLWWSLQQQQQQKHSSTTSTLIFMDPYNHHHHPPPHQQHQSSPMPCLSLNLNQEYQELENRQNQEQEEHVIRVEVNQLEKEHLFEKPLTPSDVGKLNRLVIPKQNAERYFPLSGDSGDKGLLLSFEDEVGKSWRFRYSYWNSSQSYVLTKGWSRYVKEKQLDAGDVVLFERHRRDCERLFIGWRRRGDASSATPIGVGDSWSRGLGMQQHGSTTSLHRGSLGQNQTLPPKLIGNSKRSVRLFGVDLECQLDESSEPSTPDGSTLSSHGPTHHPNINNNYYSQSAYSSNSSTTNYNYTEFTFSQDVNHMRSRRG